MPDNIYIFLMALNINKDKIDIPDGRIKIHVNKIYQRKKNFIHVSNNEVGVSCILYFFSSFFYLNESRAKIKKNKIKICIIS